LKKLAGRVIIRFSGKLGMRPGMAFGTALTIQDHGSQFASRSEGLNASAVSRFVVLIEIADDFAPSGESLQNLMSFHLDLSRESECENTR
jgi:hypothetical protein